MKRTPGHPVCSGGPRRCGALGQAELLDRPHVEHVASEEPGESHLLQLSPRFHLPFRWTQPRPHHDAPAGLAISPDGKKIYIALDDRDQVAEADTASRQILRRVRVAGGPFGLALDTAGKNLFVTCRDGDRLAVLDTQTLQETGSVSVGMGPVAVACCRTASGERLVVANSMSDDISVLSVSPLRELGRPSAGRDPFAVAITPDGTRALSPTAWLDWPR